MYSSRKAVSLLMAVALVMVACTGAMAATLNAYTVMPEKYASKVFEQFTKDTGIKVNFIRFSSGEALARRKGTTRRSTSSSAAPRISIRRDRRTTYSPSMCRKSRN